ncbi:MAG: hypothetical protein HYZ53_06350 [Planctomycetes bacterium]|nr:hypothetical protein [Planctomycetota bacterium]
MPAIERGHARDLDDVREILASGLTNAADLRAAFDEIEPGLVRFPAIEPAEFRARLEEKLRGSDEAPR